MINSLIVALMIWAIWYTMLEGEIFGKLGAFLKTHLPHQLHDPFFGCPVCMIPYYGTVIYLTLLHPLPGFDVRDFILTIIVAMGINVVINELKPKENLPPE